ncbi:hypothetical protein J1605_003428 [Eschrichtius robustus]|uniref:Serine/threonine-protein phosphatase 2A 55 kDa regulatory subunit B n=1 Tax=Eschrichtius robustus TaxID=9764 RepID=A0AB34HP78_ESCRO|nr:hypothetical protein J1605_003428 [Eschrichtius robustus]
MKTDDFEIRLASRHCGAPAQGACGGFRSLSPCSAGRVHAGAGAAGAQHGVAAPRAGGAPDRSTVGVTGSPLPPSQACFSTVMLTSVPAVGSLGQLVPSWLLTSHFAFSPALLFGELSHELGCRSLICGRGSFPSWAVSSQAFADRSSRACWPLFSGTRPCVPHIVDIKPANMEELTEVITAAEFHPHQCNVLVYSSSKGTIRLCDMRSSALCDRHSKFFEEPEDPSSRSFFSEIISSVSDVKFSHSGRYMMTRDYLSVKVWDLNMESRPVETHQVHEYLRSKLCSLYENDCIFDKFECCWNGCDSLPSGTSGGRDLRAAAVLGQSGGGWCESVVCLVMRRPEASATWLCTS